MPPFRMSDYGIHDPKDVRLNQVVETINQQYKKWVKKLCVPDENFEKEIAVLQRRSVQKQQQQNLVVFYGSSTIRLWDRLQKDFPAHHTLNLGFGGAFIHSLSTHFETLFQGLQPKAIVLYLGGNDLSLGLSAREIIDKIQSFIEMVHQKFPTTIIFNIRLSHLLSGKSFWKLFSRLIKEFSTCPSNFLIFIILNFMKLLSMETNKSVVMCC